jgi:hypothetical protein
MCEAKTRGSTALANTIVHELGVECAYLEGSLSDAPVHRRGIGGVRFHSGRIQQVCEAKIENGMGRVYETLWQESADHYLLVREGNTNDQAIPLNYEQVVLYRRCAA